MRERMLVEFSKGNLLAKAKAQPDKVRQVIEKVKTDGLAPTVHAVRSKLDQPLPLGYCNVGVVQRTEDRGQRTEGRGRRTEDRGRRAEGGGQRSENRGQRADVRGRRSEIAVGDRVASNGPQAEVVCVPKNL